MGQDDPFDLQRFKSAQADVYEAALDELESGQKRSHWMWFIFPQLRGLGRSSTATYYGISGLEEAKAYLANSLLGSRLEECTRAVLTAERPSLHAIFGSPDDLKFRSSMTLFETAMAQDVSLFKQALDRWCEGKGDEQTLELLRREKGLGPGNPSRSMRDLAGLRSQ